MYCSQPTKSRELLGFADLQILQRGKLRASVARNDQMWISSILKVLSENLQGVWLVVFPAKLSYYK